MGDRAQYFLEQSVPELLDLQEKKIFSSVEIKSITRKRNSFENALTRKIVRKADFLKYAEYEINLEALRKQRVQRLQIKGKKSISDWAGPRRIFFIFERATKRFHGDVPLWLQYIDYAKQEKSTKVLGKVYTALLQWHPTNPAVWTLASEHEMNWNGNMTAARSLMQRGLRLNTGSQQLWVDYFRLELEYLQKIYARRRILGIDRTESEEEDIEIKGFEEETSDTITFPSVTQAELNHGNNQAQDVLLKDVELSTLSTAQDNPALQGAIPKAIFASALKSMPDSPQLILGFYEVLLACTDLPFRDELLFAMVESLSSGKFRTLPQACFLRATLPCTALRNNVTHPDFPEAFKSALVLYQAAESETASLVQLVQSWTSYLTMELLVIPHIEKNLKKAICLTARKAFQSCELTYEAYQSWIAFEQAYGTAEAVARLSKEAETRFQK